MKRNWYFLIFIIAIIGLIFFITNRKSDQSFEESVIQTRIRNIGHLVLKSSGDSFSRIMPIQQINEGTFQISFEKAFIPIPDSLILISMEQLQGYGKYTIELWTSKAKNPVYSFVASTDDSEIILPCLSRPLPKSKYKIVIHFANATSNLPYLIWSVIILLVVIAGWIFYPYLNRRKPVEVNESNDSTILIGDILFYPNEQKIVFSDEQIELTGKETQVLQLLCETPNLLVERGSIQKKVWEDQGIIVTRSLDIFISRLRKKLSVDAQVKIVNVHGKGYKLEITSE